MTSLSLRRAAFGAVMLTGVVLLGGGCSRDGAKPAGKPLAWLEGRVVLPADTFDGEGPVGASLDTTVNGRRLPLAQVPVQGYVLKAGPDAPCWPGDQLWR